MKTHHSNSGFTLIELVVVTGITALILVSITSIFVTTLVSSGRNSQQKLVKAEGTYALGQIEFLLRNSVGINSCPNNAGNKEITIVLNTDDSSTAQTTLKLDAVDGGGDTRIASSSADTYYLTTPKVTVGNASIRCYGDEGGRYVEVDFTLNSNSEPNGAVKDFTPVTERFHSLVYLRNRI